MSLSLFRPFLLVVCTYWFSVVVVIIISKWFQHVHQVDPFFSLCGSMVNFTLVTLDKYLFTSSTQTTLLKVKTNHMSKVKGICQKPSWCCCSPHKQYHTRALYLKCLAKYWLSVTVFRVPNETLTLLDAYHTHSVSQLPAVMVLLQRCCSSWGSFAYGECAKPL